ncbi:recombinase RmuC [candidate division LCP-89 bacterium B3_LCP]|uniref:Recombinase RmuC n=1 Tax=candidate division LCP-89 bacterium B3_LCP TaxID=2012998 RepID=A0A532V1G1_UNCL8|nr:MAG: recombinase RmuC [candidate division LCP-89 bacterium B3_LCP]
MTLAIITLVVGFILGISAAFLLKIIHSKNARELAAEMYRETDSQRQQQVEQVIESVKSSFGSLSLEALSKSTEEFLKLAKGTLEIQTQAGSKELESKKSLIDQQLKSMTGELDKVGRLMKDLENDRVEKFGQLDRQLRVASEQTARLMDTTGQLKEALASSKVRGQWGERMAEDVLRVAGFIENVNYRKQMTMESTGKRPDFTFFLPQNQIINMDVKFPLDNYLKFLEAESSGDSHNAEEFRKQFLRDVKNRIKEVAGREYINPAENTVDYVLLFIPNEQVYAFIHEQDRNILDEGLKQHVVFCSPVTLFAVLAVIRQAVDNFNLEQTSHEILSLLGSFNKQWNEYVARMEMMGKRLEDAKNEYDKLVTTRRNKLEVPLRKIEDLRNKRGITAVLPGEIPLPPEE